jgi:hypothetical protein
MTNVRPFPKTDRPSEERIHPVNTRRGNGCGIGLTAWSVIKPLIGPA